LLTRRDHSDAATSRKILDLASAKELAGVPGPRGAHVTGAQHRIVRVLADLIRHRSDVGEQVSPAPQHRHDGSDNHAVGPGDAAQTS
jgi:hypothetical protein